MLEYFHFLVRKFNFKGPCILLCILKKALITSALLELYTIHLTLYINNTNDYLKK